MGLRCKEGDLAVVLRSNSDRVGRICSVDEFVGIVNLNGRGIYDDVWMVSYNGETHSQNGFRWGARDYDLVPIRPNELKEEEEKEVTA